MNQVVHRRVARLMSKNSHTHSSSPQITRSNQQVEQQDTITSYQAYVLVVSQLIGVGMLSFQRAVAEVAGAAGIWITVLCGVISAIGIYFFTKLCQRFPKKTLVQFIPEILKTKRMKWIGTGITGVILIGFGFYFIFIVGLSARNFSEATKSIMLIRTPIEAVIISLLLVTTLASYTKPVILGMLNEILFPFLLIPFLMHFYVVYQRGELVNLLPLFDISWQGVIYAIPKVMIVFAGFSIILLLAGYYQQPEKALTSHLSAIGTVTVLAVFSIVAQFSVLGTDEIVKDFWNTIDFFKEAQSELLILERTDAFMIALWVVAVFTTITITQSVLVRLISEAFHIKEKDTKYIAWLLFPLIYGIAMYPENIAILQEYLNNLVVYGYFSSGAVVLILLLIAVLRKKGKTKKKGESEHASQSQSTSS